MKDRKLTILIILIVTLSLVGIGIAFAAFSQTLTINGSAEVEASKWQVVFEGMTNTSTIDAPVVTGTAEEVTHPSIKNNATEISTYSVSLKTPGDSITYNFKIHNKGDYAANLGALTISGVNRPTSPVTGAALVTDSSVATQNANTLAVTEYKFYYTDNNQLVGQDAKDCLEPGESENVSLRITFASSSATDTSILPSTDLVLDNLGVTAIYNQSNNGECSLEPAEPVTDANFQNIDLAYYTYEGKSFIGTGVDNVLISENIISKAKWSNAASTQCSDGSAPSNNKCPAGTTPVFASNPAQDASAAYCTNCRLMTRAEACAWAGASATCSGNPPYKNKVIAKYNGSVTDWWLADSTNAAYAWGIDYMGYYYNGYTVTSSYGVRPAISVTSGSTISGSGTQGQPYVITVN